MKDIARSLKLPLFTAYSRLRVARQRFAKEVRRKQQVAALPRGPAVDRGRPGGAGLADRSVAGRRAPHPGCADGREAAGAGAGVAAGARGAVARIRRASWGRRSAARGLVGAGRCGACWSSLAGFGLLSRGPRSAGASSARGIPPAAAITAIAGRPRACAPAASAAARGAGRRQRLARARRAPRRGWPRAWSRYWRFDEIKGTATTRDLSGQGVDCVLRRIDSTDWTQGQLGRAIRLAGGGWVECPAGAGLRRITDRITIAAWVQHAQKQPPPAHRRLAPARHRAATTTSTWGWSGAG